MGWGSSHQKNKNGFLTSENEWFSFFSGTVYRPAGVLDPPPPGYWGRDTPPPPGEGAPPPREGHAPLTPREGEGHAPPPGRGCGAARPASAAHPHPRPGCMARTLPELVCVPPHCMSVQLVLACLVLNRAQPRWPAKGALLGRSTRTQPLLHRCSPLCSPSFADRDRPSALGHTIDIGPRHSTAEGQALVACVP